LGDIINTLQGRVGVLILRHWNFPEAMIEVVKEANNFSYTHEGEANFVDLVQTSLLQGGHIDDAHAPADWDQVPAFSKLGMDTEVNIIEIEENQEMIENTKQTLMI